jgi:hypothetical protein
MRPGLLPRLALARAQRLERVDQILELRLFQHDCIRLRHAAELDHHARKPLGVRDRVLELRAIAAAGVRADHEQEAQKRHGRARRGGVRGHEQHRQENRKRGVHFRTSF